MFVTIINDCCDFNTIGRQETRAALLFNSQVTLVGVGFNATLEAAGNLIDILDASAGEKGVILVNVAPRHGEAKQWDNGTPFGYFYYKNTLVVSSVAGFTLSLIKKLAITSQINLLDIPTVVKYAITECLIEKAAGKRIITSQFRSFDFLPRVAKWIWDGKDIPYTPYPITKISDAPKGIWLVDNFGNCKTTLLPEDLQFLPGKQIATTRGRVSCYSYLKDVPNGHLALIQGSSGIDSKRFLELVIQGQAVAKKLHLSIGSVI